MRNANQTARKVSFFNILLKTKRFLKKLPIYLIKQKKKENKKKVDPTVHGTFPLSA